MLTEGNVRRDNVHHKEQDVESGEHAIKTRAIGLKWVFKLKRNEEGEVEAQGPSSGEGLRLEARSRLRRDSHANGKVGIRPPVAGNRGTLLLVGPPHGRKVRFPQRRAHGDRLCLTTTWIHGK